MKNARKVEAESQFDSKKKEEEGEGGRRKEGDERGVKNYEAAIQSFLYMRDRFPMTMGDRGIETLVVMTQLDKWSVSWLQIIFRRNVFSVNSGIPLTVVVVSSYKRKGENVSATPTEGIVAARSRFF